MSRFTTFLALVVGGMEVMQPSAGVLASIDLKPVGPFQRRQTATTSALQGPTCGFFCDSIISIVASDSCSPTNCCTASFELSYFNCFVCLANIVDLTDYTVPQSNVDQLYDQCASLGISIPILSFPGQSPDRPLSSVAPPSSQTTAAITFASLPSIIQPTASNGTSVPTLTSPATTTLLTSAPIPTSTSSSGIRSVETSGFDRITSAMMLGLWLYFVVQ